MIACLTLDLTWLLVWIIAASVRTEGTLEVIQGNSCSKQDQHWGRTRVFRALFSQVSKPLRMEDPPRFWVPAAVFILWVKNVFLVSRPNHFYSTVSHPPATQHCEEPGSAGFVFLLTPPQVTPTAEERAGAASLQLLWAQPSSLLSFLAASHLTCPIQEAVRNWDRFFCLSDIQQPVSPLPWEVYSGKSGILLKLTAHEAKVSVSKGNGNNPCEIPHINFAAGGFRGN